MMHCGWAPTPIQPHCIMLHNTKDFTPWTMKLDHERFSMVQPIYKVFGPLTGNEQWTKCRPTWLTMHPKSEVMLFLTCAPKRQIWKNLKSDHFIVFCCHYLLFLSPQKIEKQKIEILLQIYYNKPLPFSTRAHLWLSHFKTCWTMSCRL